MDIVEKRSDTIAKIIRENTDIISDKEMLLAELINDELLREDITFNQKLQIITWSNDGRIHLLEIWKKIVNE